MALLAVVQDTDRVAELEQTIFDDYVVGPNPFTEQYEYVSYEERVIQGYGGNYTIVKSAFDQINPQLAELLNYYTPKGFAALARVRKDIFNIVQITIKGNLLASATAINRGAINKDTIKGKLYITANMYREQGSNENVTGHMFIASDRHTDIKCIYAENHFGVKSAKSYIYSHHDDVEELKYSISSNQEIAIKKQPLAVRQAEAVSSSGLLGYLPVFGSRLTTSYQQQQPAAEPHSQIEIHAKISQEHYRRRPLDLYERIVDDKIVEQTEKSHSMSYHLYRLDEYKNSKMWSELSQSARRSLTAPFVMEKRFEGNDYVEASPKYEYLFKLDSHGIYPDFELEHAVEASNFWSSSDR